MILALILLMAGIGTILVPGFPKDDFDSKDVKER